MHVHDRGLCESDRVGEGTRIWAFAHVLPGAVLGKDCNICDHVFIEDDVVLGDRVTVKSGVQLWDGIRVEDDVFIGPNATFTNDLFPRSKRHLERYPILQIERGASVGANSTILPGVTIGRHAMVGAGSVVTRDVPPHAIVRGNPARIVGYVGGSREEGDGGLRPSSTQQPDVSGVRIVSFTRATDLRGSLAAADHRDLPFTPRRTFLVYGVPTSYVRGEHAHRVCEQLLVCVHGSVKCLVDDGYRRQEVSLHEPTVGLYIPPMVWGTQFEYSADAVLLVLASEEYDPEDYIRDYAQFVEERERWSGRHGLD